jgi:hypothetical protein
MYIMLRFSLGNGILPIIVCKHIFLSIGLFKSDNFIFLSIGLFNLSCDLYEISRNNSLLMKHLDLQPCQWDLVTNVDDFPVTTDGREPCLLVRLVQRAGKWFSSFLALGTDIVVDIADRLFADMSFCRDRARCHRPPYSPSTPSRFHRIRTWLSCTSLIPKFPLLLALCVITSHPLRDDLFSMLWTPFHTLFRYRSDVHSLETSYCTFIL